MYHANSVFMQLWAKIPTIVNRGDAVFLLNVIDSERMDGFLSQGEEFALEQAVFAVAQARSIPMVLVEV